MSIPSSSEEVATRQGSWPDLSSSSTRSAPRGTASRGGRGRSRTALPRRSWCCPRARSLGAPLQLVVVHLVEPLRDPLRRSPVVDEDDRRGVLPDQLAAAPGRSRARSSGCSWPGRATPRSGRGRCARGVLQLRVLVRRLAGSAPSRRLSTAGWARPCPRRERRSRGRVACGSEASTISHSRPVPTRKSPMRSSGRWVAERPIRWTVLASPRWSSRSSVSARCEPRFDGATAWISSTITASTPPEDLARLRADHQIERLRSGDQDVRRLATHRAALGLGRVARCAARPRSAPRCPVAAPSGCARCRRTGP